MVPNSLRHKVRRLNAWMSVGFLAISLSACDYQSDTAKPKDSESRINDTVGSAKTAQIGRFENVRGVEWVSEQEISFSKTLKAGESNGRYETTRGVLSIRNGGIRDTQPWGWNDTRVVSPDGKQAYIVLHRSEGENLYAKHVIEELATGRNVTVSAENVAGTGLWLDNESYLLIPGIGEGPAKKIGLNGTAAPLPAFSEKILQNPEKFQSSGHFRKSGDRIYYLGRNGPGTEHRLNYFSIKDLEQPVVTSLDMDDDVTRYEISPDGTIVAIVKSVSSNGNSEYELVLADRDGAEAAGGPIWKSRSTFELSWSPDSSKLAFSGRSAPDSAERTMIVEAATGIIGQVFESKRIEGPALWSPSGNMLMITADEGETGIEALPVVHIIRLEQEKR